jgi:DinB family protein
MLTGHDASSTVTPVMAVRRSTSLAKWRRAAVRRIAASRDATLAFAARLPEPEILRPRTLDRWSVKDALAHLLACDEETVRRFRLIARGQGRRIHWFESMADADRFNARSVTRARHLGPRAVLGRIARARDDLIGRLERLPIAALDDPSHEYTVVQWLPEPGWSHVRDHLDEMKRWWRSRRAELAGRPRARRATPRSGHR